MAKISKAILITLAFCLLPLFAKASTLSVSPASGTFEVGDKVTVRILVSTGAPINAISGTVSFPTSIFTIESVSKSGSILDFWVSEPNFSAGAGTLQFEGVTLGGFEGGTGTVVTAVLKAIKIGSGKVSFKSGQVLANDGQGTNVTSGLIGATFSVEAKKEVAEPPLLEEPAEPELPLQPPALTSPEISIISKNGEKTISGVSEYPFYQILLTFVSDDGTKIFLIDSTDDRGGFSIQIPHTLKYGSYQVYAIIIQKDGAHSYISNELTVKIGNILSDISLKIKAAIVVLIILLVYLIIGSYFYLRRNKKLSVSVKQEAEQAEDVTFRYFKKLKDKINRAVDVEADVTKKENIKDLRADIKEAEDLITKEIKDIENL